MSPLEIFKNKLNKEFKGKFRRCKKLTNNKLYIERNSGLGFVVLIEKGEKNKQLFFRLSTIYSGKPSLKNSINDTEITYFIKYIDDSFLFFDREEILSYYVNNMSNIREYNNTFDSKEIKTFSIRYDYATSRFLKFKM